MTLQEKKTLIADFLEKCNRYADTKLAQYHRDLAAAAGNDRLMLQDKVGHWTAYRTFNEYTLRELAADTLDDWFEDAGPK
jgi:hypothetical protein